MPSSPRTPTKAENRVNIDSSPYGYSNGYAKSSHSRKSSLYSPSTPRPQSAHGIPTMLSDFAGAMDGGNDLGSLADELAEAWDEDGEGEEEVLLLQMDAQGGYTPIETLEAHHGENGVVSSPAYGRGLSGVRSPKKMMEQFKARRRQSAYDGLDYSEDSDFEQSPGMSRALEARIAIIEELARPGTEEDGARGDDVVERVIDGLKDLGAQSSVENGTTRSVPLLHDSLSPRPSLTNDTYRLITAHTALATHVAHQTRMLQTLSFPLLSPLAIPPDCEVIDDLLPLLIDTPSTLPQPTTSALTSLLQLSTYTMDLITTLNQLSDTLHMSRQTMTLANRRLRTARDLVTDMQKETMAWDEGVRWIEEGDWQTRLTGRECAGVCKDVVGGFEEVCQEWRDRLLASASASAEVGAA